MPLRERLRAIPARWILLGLAGLLIVVLLFGVALGPVHIPVATVFSILLHHLPGLEGLTPVTWTSAEETIVWTLRLPRVLLAAAVGGGLAAAGVSMQGLFKNPLADPYIVGISSGATLGATIVLVAGWNVTELAIGSFVLELPELGYGLMSLAAFLAALGIVGLVYRLARTGTGLPLTTLLLAGLAMSALASALTALVIYLSPQQRASIFLWLMGGIQSSWTAVGFVVPAVAIGALVLILWARDLDALSLGDEQALFLGVEVERRKRHFLLVSTLVTAVGASFVGIIGFVGLIIPHMLRLVLGPLHRLLLPASVLGGASFLVLCDLIARTVLSGVEIPVGIITALAGTPFFLFLLVRSKAFGGEFH